MNQMPSDLQAGYNGPDMEFATLCKKLRDNLAHIEPALEEGDAWRDFFDAGNVRANDEPDPYNHDMDYEVEKMNAMARASAYYHPALPSAGNIETCAPCPNAACPYLDAVKKESICPLLIANPSREAPKMFNFQGG